MITDKLKYSINDVSYDGKSIIKHNANNKTYNLIHEKILGPCYVAVYNRIGSWLFTGIIMDYGAYKP